MAPLLVVALLLCLLELMEGKNEIKYNLLGQPTYGVDVSFPHHYAQVSTNYDWLPHNADGDSEQSTPLEYEGVPVQRLGNRQDFYDRYLEGCRAYYGSKGPACDDVEDDRISMNLRQPQSMQNYTELGFKKIRAPKEIFDVIQQFWEDNHGREEPEEWFTGNTYTNHWESPTYMLNVEDTSLLGGGNDLKRVIWDLAKTTLQEWTGQQLTPCSLYGVRKYESGAVLATHVDRLPLVSSAIINVAQDVDDPWPLEVYAHDGMAYNVTMDPGDMVLYESHSVLHGRPFPLKGRYYANVFIHFEPVGHSLQHGMDMDAMDEVDSTTGEVSGHENVPNNGLPPYILPNSPEEESYRKEHGDEQWEPAGEYEEEETGSTIAHYAAISGDVSTLNNILENGLHDLLHTPDVNGWLPIHEAARAGRVEIIQILVDNDADVNERTAWGEGQSVLNLAYEYLEEDHPVIEYLLSLGAEDLGLEDEL